jgi:hypothetical protein
MNQQMQTTEDNTTKNFYLGGFNIGLDPDDQMELNQALAKNTSDLAKGAVQLGAETVGFANAMIDAPLNQGTRDSDYYGPIDGFNRIFSNMLGYSGDQEALSGITIPTEEYLSNPRFVEHMADLNKYSEFDAARAISPEFGDAVKTAQQTGNIEDFTSVFNKLRDEAILNEDLAQQLLDFKNQTWRIMSFDESQENIIVNKLPQIDEGLFGIDMTPDPYFSKKGDLVLPGEGVFGMRDGSLNQLASAVGRPLDEMLIEGNPGAEFIAKNVTDKVALSGPEIMPPKGTGPMYMVPMMSSLFTGVGVPAAKGIMAVGRAATRTKPIVTKQRKEPYLYEGILSNIK